LRVLGGTASVIVGVGAGCANVLNIDSDRHVGAPDSSTLDGPVSDVQDESTEDAGPYANVPPNWQCLNKSLPAKDGGPVELEFLLNSASGNSSSVGNDNGTPVTGATFHACNTLDVGCLNPITADSTSDDAGLAFIRVPDAFTGYYELHASGFQDTILSRPAQYHSIYQTQGLAPQALVAAGAALAGATQDPTLGFAVVTACDCTVTASGPTAAPGVTFTIEGNAGPGEQVVYLAANLPTSGATQTDAVSGSAIIFNIPVAGSGSGDASTDAATGASTLTLRASFASTGQEIRTVSALVRQNWVTYVDVWPDQADWVHLPDGGP
jgi:hypothetical protein